MRVGLSKSRALIAGSALALGACGGGGSSSPAPPAPPPPPPPPPPPLSTGPAACTGGMAEEFPCSGVSLRARLPYESMQGTVGNDIWGWTDSLDGSEYALVGMTNGTAFVNVSDPDNPVFIGRLPTATSSSIWRDIKVYENYAYIVADNALGHGMQVFDLTRLRGLMAPQVFVPEVSYGDFGDAHNVAINEDTGFAYAVGTDTCLGGLHMIDIRTPVNPMFAGCFDLAETHDTQCVVYAGPDTEHQGKEICVSSNEDHVGIVDVSVKTSPTELSRAVYPDVRFTHQGWLTEDHAYFFLGDEGDETGLGVGTRTHVFDLSDLDAPQHLFLRTAATPSIDHNMYVRGDRLYQANYTSGLRVLRIGDLAASELAEIAFFDTFPLDDAVGFDGAWSVFPFFPSGTVIVSDVTNGLFVLTVEVP